MSSTFRPRRAFPSAVNTPTLTRVNASSYVKNSEAEQILTEFISASEANNEALPGSILNNENNTTGFSNNAESGAVLSQLKRVQRDLRGLPPLIAEPPVVSTNSTENKKIKFDDNYDTFEQPKHKKIKFESEEPEAVEEEKIVEKEEEADEDNEEDGEVTVTEETEKKHKKEKKEKKEKKHKKEKKEKHHKKSDDN
ncbi:RNA polymerase I subunit RPA14-domain-containing protein [Scheffersomyces xylosifermentans]|uniref:RNA polymerase I subunit RPA14-domain-containing protein n=1 Tax=Scheffersomyces xylosifermentans TaxID=1304137 RepID=UPI00315D3D2D